MTALEIPLAGKNETFNVTLAEVEYTLTVTYRNVAEAGWILAIAKNGVNLISGIPLVTGADLLAQYAHLGIGGALYVATDGDRDAVPTFENLGTLSHLYWVAN